MKTGICNTAYFSDELNAVDYKKLKEHGFDCGDYQQLSSIKGKLYQLDESEFKKTLTDEREAADRNGITFSQVHGPFIPEGDTEEKLPILKECAKKAVRGAALLGSRYLVIHTLHPFNWDETGDQDESYRVNFGYFTELCKYAEEFGVCICAENLPFKNRRLSYTKELAAFVNELNSPNLFICFDTGHSNICDENIKESILLCGDKLKVFHIHDNNKSGDVHKLPYNGTVNWDGFREGVKEIGFNGCLSLETEIKRTCPEIFRKRIMTCYSDILRYMGD